jgi:hypothetical protein
MSEELIQPEGQGINPTEGNTSDEGGAQDAEALQKELEELRRSNAQLKAYAKKLKGKSERADFETPEPSQSDTVDERILKANGMPDELLTQLKKVARFTEKDLITAQKDPMFVAMKEHFEQEQRDKEASLGASNGSGAMKAQKDFKTSGLTVEEHKEMWRKTMR